MERWFGALRWNVLERAIIFLFKQEEAGNSTHLQSCVGQVRPNEPRGRQFPQIPCCCKKEREASKREEKREREREQKKENWGRTSPSWAWEVKKACTRHPFFEGRRRIPASNHWKRPWQERRISCRAFSSIPLPPFVVWRGKRERERERENRIRPCCIAPVWTPATSSSKKKNGWRLHQEGKAHICGLRLSEPLWFLQSSGPAEQMQLQKPAATCTPCLQEPFHPEPEGQPDDERRRATVELSYERSRWKQRR